MNRQQYSELEHIQRTFLEESPASSEDYDYLELAQHIFSSVELKLENNNLRIQTCHLSLTQRRRAEPHIRSIELEDQAHSVEIVRLYHHGVEELFCVSFPGQHVSQQPCIRSLRNRHDDMLKQSMRWLCMMVLTIREEDMA